MKRREMKLLLEERFERIALLETRIDTMDQLVEGYRAREQAILDTLQAAKERAAKMIEEATAEAERTRAAANAEAEQTRTAASTDAEQALETANREAEQLRTAAKEEADALLAHAQTVSSALQAEAERNTTELVAIAKADSDRMLQDVEIIKREYEEMVESFNAMLAQNASELQVTASRFADFVKDRKLDPPEIRMDGDAFYKSVGLLSDAALPDASGDPAMLMQNIYRMQNRPLPEDIAEGASHDKTQDPATAQDQPEKASVTQTQPEGQSAQPAQLESPGYAHSDGKPAFPIEDGSGADERQGVIPPYSEAAWVDEALESESEPQAEFTEAFENAYTDSDFVVSGEGCQVMQSDAEQEFDALFAAPAFALGGAAAVIPAAVAANVATQAEAELAFDEFFGERFDPNGKAAQDEGKSEQAEDPQGSKPTPYSEAAWEQGAFTSDHEPQAEGALFSGELEREIKPTPPENPLAKEATSAFDDYFSAYRGTPAADAAAIPEPVAPQEPAAAPKPYSEAAWAKPAFTSDHEPQAEGALFSEEQEREAAPAPLVSPLAQEATSAFDDYYSAYRGTSAPDADAVSAAEPVTAQEPAAAPEPYSESAWAQGAFTSDNEPQAEGGLFAAEEPEEEEPAPTPRRYNEYGELREWEPEVEPEMGDIPTVSRYMGQSGSSEEVSLDQLLDEIIKAGE